MNVSQVIAWVIVGAVAGTVTGAVVRRSKAGFGRWVNLGVGLIGALIGGSLLRVFSLDLGLGKLEIRYDDLLAAFIGSLIFLVALWKLHDAVAKKPGAKEG